MLGYWSEGRTGSNYAESLPGKRLELFPCHTQQVLAVSLRMRKGAVPVLDASLRWVWRFAA